jgi:hypothetical protein
MLVPASQKTRGFSITKPTLFGLMLFTGEFVFHPDNHKKPINILCGKFQMF